MFGRILKIVMAKLTLVHSAVQADGLWFFSIRATYVHVRTGKTGYTEKMSHSDSTDITILQVSLLVDSP